MRRSGSRRVSAPAASRPSGLLTAVRDLRSGSVPRRVLVPGAHHSIRAAQTRKVTDMSQSMAATGLLMMLGVAPAAADCLSARQALLTARYEVGAAALEEMAASKRYIAARAELEAARLRREREERRARHAARDHVEARDVCRHVDDDRDAVRACERRAAAVYDRALAARRHAEQAARVASSTRTRARSALTDWELAVSSARDSLRDARRRVRRECRP